MKKLNHSIESGKGGERENLRLSPSDLALKCQYLIGWFTRLMLIYGAGHKSVTRTLFNEVFFKGWLGNSSNSLGCFTEVGRLFPSIFYC